MPSHRAEQIRYTEQMTRSISWDEISTRHDSSRKHFVEKSAYLVLVECQYVNIYLLKRLEE